MHKNSIIISIDAMGGSHAPEAVIQGLSRVHSKHSGILYQLFGDSVKINTLLAEIPELMSKCKVTHCSSIIADDQQPIQALKKGKDSSMRKAIDALKDGQADACISGGNTGALMVMAKMVLGTLEGISRPAIVSTFPNLKGGVIMLDLGANSECDAHNFFQFALMGHCFAQATLQKISPSIGILNVGVEGYKGREIERKAHALLKDSGLNFVGYVEGHDIAAGSVDIAVTDGFSGNLVIKTAEGVANICKDIIKIAFESSIFTKIAALLAKKSLKVAFTKIDPRKYNGAMLIGIRGIIVKSHGSSDDIAFANALETTINLVKQQINQKIHDHLATLRGGGEENKDSLVGKIIKKLGF